MKMKITTQWAPAVFALLLALSLAACGSDEAGVVTAVAVEEEEIPTNAPPEEATGAEEAAGEGPVVVENEDGPPFYARFGENEMFGDGEQVVVVFYRPPDCIPDDFNLNQFFHFPGEESPGAYACAPPTVSSIDTWETAPGEDPAPLVSETTGLGAVPVWFFAEADIQAALADGTVTIGELEALPSRQVGTATTYDELLHPSQSNENALVQFTAEGALEDGTAFTVDVSKGDPDTADHVTIDLGG